MPIGYVFLDCLLDLGVTRWRDINGRHGAFVLEKLDTGFRSMSGRMPLSDGRIHVRGSKPWWRSSIAERLGKTTRFAGDH